MNVQGFRIYLLTLGLRKPTVAKYCSYIAALPEFTPEIVQETILTALNKGTKNSSINVFLRAVKKYCEFEKLDWIKELKYLKEDETQKAILSDQEIEDLISLPCPPRFHQSVWDRWTLFLKIMAYTGMRPSEVATLTVNQIDFGTNNFLLPITKTTPRKVPIPHLLHKDLKEYISNTKEYLFPPTQGTKKHIWRNGWIKHFRKRANLLGIRPEVTIYSLRHSFITSLLEEDVSLPKVMKVVGHKNIETTFRYTHLTNKDSQEAIKRHRLGKKHTSPQERFKHLIEDLKRSGIFDDPDFTYQVSNNKIVIEIEAKKCNSENNDPSFSKVRTALG